MFKRDYLQTMDANNGSLFTTLVQLKDKFIGDSISIGPDEIRNNILKPSIFHRLFLELKTAQYSDVLIDSGAMYFLAMGQSFLDELRQFGNVLFVYLKTFPTICFSNLFSNFQFMDRGFIKDIRSHVQTQFNQVIPVSKKDGIEFFKTHSDIYWFAQQEVDAILHQSLDQLEHFVKTLNNPIVTIHISNPEDYKTLPNKMQNILPIHLYLLKQKPQAVFFDMSSTILDSHKSDLEAVNTVLAKYGLPSWQDGTRKKKDVRKSMKENFPNFFGPENAEQAYKDYISALIDQIPNMPLIEGSIDVLDFCKKNGILTLIISNRDKEFVSKVITHFKLEDYFNINHIIVADDLKITKPNPDMILIPCRNLGLNPKRVILVGDAFADIGCAFASGSIPILFTEIVRDEISTDDSTTLMKLFPSNSLRKIGSMKELINLLEASKPMWEKE